MIPCQPFTDEGRRNIQATTEASWCKEMCRCLQWLLIRMLCCICSRRDPIGALRSSESSIVPEQAHMSLFYVSSCKCPINPAVVPSTICDNRKLHACLSSGTSMVILWLTTGWMWLGFNQWTASTNSNSQVSILLNLSSCNCKTSWGCRCRTTGIHCSPLCGQCHGGGCSNSEQLETGKQVDEPSSGVQCEESS